MRRLLRHLLILVFTAIAAIAWCDQAQVRVTFWPTIAVADQHSTVDVTAEVRDSSGRLLPTATSVLFQTDRGSFRSAVVTTSNGTAHAVLVAGGDPGIAHITVSALSAEANPTVLTYEFVANRSELQSAKEYVEITAPGYMQYANDIRIIGASAKGKGVTLRYRDITIQADDLQYFINNYVVKAHHAHVQTGRLSQDFEELYLVLNSRTGFGTTNFTAPAPEVIGLAAGLPTFLNQTGTGYEVAKARDRFGLVSISRDVLSLSPQAVADTTFQLTDLSTSPSTVSAKRATVFPRKGIQFQSAELYVANAKIIKLPLFVIDFNANNTSPLVTDGIVSINDNQLGLNYPQYLVLRPGLTSDLRFHMGDRYGRGLGSNRGAFLDYELGWSHGDDLEGAFTVGGIGRNDWDLQAHQYWRVDGLTTANAQFTLPSGQGLFASGAVNHEFAGFSGVVNANHSQTFTGITSSSQSYGASLMSNPRKVANLPLRFSYGFLATQTLSDDQVLGRRQQDGRGLSTQFQSEAVSLDKASTLTTSWQISKLFGTDVARTLNVNGNVNISRKLSKSASLLLIYNYTQDGFNDVALGRHMFTLQGNYHAGNAGLNLLASKSLGLERMNLYGDVSYSLSKLWRLSYNYTSQTYLTDRFLDYNVGIGYRIGWREVGITWSRATSRFGLQLLGAQF